MKKQNFEVIEVGTKKVASRIITQQDVETFAQISGDCNPLHLEKDFADRTIFKGRIVHGMLVAGLISAALSKFDGVVVYLSQSLNFLKPVRAGDRIEATVEVVEKIERRRRLRLRTVCKNQQGEVIIDGEAKVKIMEIENPNA
ncbi:MAG: MaoC family dehydratase [Dehalococcoidia bacterium]|nr:MaoC family dehydratase [Dehalococcoidia bacterium]